MHPALLIPTYFIFKWNKELYYVSYCYLNDQIKLTLILFWESYLIFFHQIVMKKNKTVHSWNKLYHASPGRNGQELLSHMRKFSSWSAASGTSAICPDQKGPIWPTPWNWQKHR